VSHIKKSQKIGRRRFDTIIFSTIGQVDRIGQVQHNKVYVLSTTNRPMFPDIPSQRGTIFSSAMRIDLLTNHPQFHIFGPYCALFYPILPFWLVVAISPSKPFVYFV
jgi:hypothetical protein